jgi:uncharacterized protein (UPF0332 family)
VTDENRHANIQSEVVRDDATLSSAELLLAAGHAADAVGRADYGAFHYARALLFTLGEDPVTHAGVEKLLHRHWVKTGDLDAEIARRFSKLQKMRIEADYSVEFVFTQSGAEEEVAVAREFVGAVRALLAKADWLG